MKRDEHCFYKDINVDFCDCDSHERMKLQTAMRYMADIAGCAYASKGFTHTWLWEHGFVFLLSRVSIHFNRIPKSEEKLTIETWEREVKGAIFYRDVIFYDDSGEPVVECDTAWILVNPITRAIIKPSKFTGGISPHMAKKANCLAASRLKFEGNFENIGTRRIVYSDIDGNNHVYNAVYAGIACDFLPTEILDRGITDFVINFKQEALLKDELLISTQISESCANVVGKTGTKVSFECKFVF